MGIESISWVLLAIDALIMAVPEDTDHKDKGHERPAITASAPVSSAPCKQAHCMSRVSPAERTDSSAINGSGTD